MEEVEPGQYRVDRSMLLAVLDKPEELSRGLKSLVQGDAFVIRGLSKSAPLARAGLRRGDRVVRVGGTSVRNAQGLLQLLAGAARRKSLELQVVRNGRSLTLNYQFE